MEDLGIDDSETSSALSESLALKAFLRLKREERRRHISSSVPLSEKLSTPSQHERSHNYSVSYDPVSYLEISNIDVPPETPMVGYTPRKEVDFDEEQKFTNLYTDDRGGSSGGVNTSFSSMHAIINTSFQEKIDYQRKLREQQSELAALRDKLQLLKTENTRLTVAAIKSKQKQLPIILRNLMRRRRQNKLRRAMRRWFELCYEKNVDMVRRSEEYWAGEQLRWQDRQRMLARLVKRSVALNMRFVLRRLGTGQVRRAFSRWVAYSSSHGPRLQAAATHLSRTVQRRRTRELLRVWQAKYKFKTVLLRRFQNFSVLFGKHSKGRAMCAWKRHVHMEKSRQRLYFFLLRNVRHSRTYKLFQTWKHFAFVSYPLKIHILKRLVRRGVLIQTGKLRVAWSVWKSFSQSATYSLLVLRRILAKRRPRSMFLAFDKWKAVTRQGKWDHVILVHLYRNCERQWEWGKRKAFVRWLMTVKDMQCAEQRNQLTHSFEKMESTKYHFQKALTRVRREHEEARQRTAAYTRLVFRAVRSVSVYNCKTAKLMAALHRWKWAVNTEYSIQAANRRNHMLRVRSVLNSTFLHKQLTAFAKWKEIVRQFHRTRIVVMKMLRNSSRKNTRIAFQMWVNFSVNTRKENAQAKFALYRMRHVLSAWRHSSLMSAWRRWKENHLLAARALDKLRSCVRVFWRVQLRSALSTWRELSIFSELRVTRRQLIRSETASESRLKVAFLGIMKRGMQKYFVVWQEYTRQTVAVKKTVLLLLQRNMRARLHRGFSTWRDLVTKLKFMSSGCRAVRRVFITKIADALLRAFRLWVLHMTEGRARDANMLHGRLEQTMHELDRSRSEVQYSKQALQQMTLLIQTLEDREREQDYKMLHIMSVFSDRHTLKKVLHAWHHCSVISRHQKQLARQVILRLYQKSTAASMVIAFNKWVQFNRRSIFTFRLIKKSVLRWSHGSMLAAFNKWRLTTYHLRSDEMMSHLDRTASKQILYLISNHAFEYYFEKVTCRNHIRFV